MQAMILAAGLGTRLKPHTDLRPKPLFTIDGVSLLERHIQTMAAAGCHSIIINTCHLAREIHRFIKSKTWPVPVHLRRESTLLDSAGAVANVTDLLDGSPLIVVNGDTLTDICPKALVKEHLSQGACATLALLDRPEFNNVSVETDGKIRGFREATPPGMRRLAFTGMQVLSPAAVAAIPKGVPFGMVDLYRALIKSDQTVLGMPVESRLWFDCGTEERYLEASRALMIPKAFLKAFGAPPPSAVITTRLKGDGSDRTWSRLTAPKGSIIACEHGIHSKLESEGQNTGEARAMIRIGNHLQRQGIPTSPILAGDPVSGLVFVRDAGNTHLAEVATTLPPRAVETLYQKIIATLIDFSQKGIQGFDTRWCWQTPAYDHEMILSMECHYFINAFINGYLGMQDETTAPYQEAFEHIADNALSGELSGLMHRDFQSRNIMMDQDTPVIIDFQGARRGPLQYDLASLLIDPYAALPMAMQDRLLDHTVDALNAKKIPVAETFQTSYTFCAIARNLQMLGAFGKLSKLGKPGFEAHIPLALHTLKTRLQTVNEPKLDPLQRLLERIMG